MNNTKFLLSRSLHSSRGAEATRKQEFLLVITAMKKIKEERREGDVVWEQENMLREGMAEEGAFKLRLEYQGGPHPTKI